MKSCIALAEYFTHTTIKVQEGENISTWWESSAFKTTIDHHHFLCYTLWWEKVQSNPSEFISFLCTIDNRIITCFACRSPVCDLFCGPISRRRPADRRRWTRAQYPAACCTYSTLTFPALCKPSQPQRFACGHRFFSAAAWTNMEVCAVNITHSLISTLGKAISTKPINPWASDGTDLIPAVADALCLPCAAPNQFS